MIAPWRYREQARELVRGSWDGLRLDRHHLEDAIANAMHEAVEAERERCSKVAGIQIGAAP